MMSPDPMRERSTKEPASSCYQLAERQAEELSDMTSEIAFRRLAEADIPTLKRWLEDPDVAPWYQEDSTELDALRASYLPVITGEEPTRAFIIRIDGRDAGYIQGYVIDDHSDYARQIAVDPGAVGIDLFIGEPWARNRGHGAAVLRAFLREVVFGAMGAAIAIIAPAPDNARAIRAYERAGFRWVKTVPIVDESPANTGDEYVMRLPHRDFDPRA
jgi:aminoglycoside 6'-N-acetyltransferase